jgi:excisionase family DNA binding protein
VSLNVALFMTLYRGIVMVVNSDTQNDLIGGIAMDVVPGSDALFSVDEAAKRLGGISKWTVHAWLSQGKLQRTKVGGRTMIRESELQKVIQDGGKSPAPNRGGQWR